MHNSKCISGNSSRATEARKRLKWSFQKPKPIATFSCLALGWWMDFWKCSWWWALCASFMGWKLDCNILKHQKYTLQKPQKGFSNRILPLCSTPPLLRISQRKSLSHVTSTKCWLHLRGSDVALPTSSHLLTTTCMPCVSWLGMVETNTSRHTW